MNSLDIEKILLKFLTKKLVLFSAKMKNGSKHLRKERDEEKAAKALLEEVQERRLQIEDEMWLVLDNYLFSWEPGKRRSVSLNDKFWKLVQPFWLKPFWLKQLWLKCTIPIPVEFDRSMSVSLSSSSGADVDMRVSSNRGIVEVESEPSWVASFMERMDANERRIEQVLGLHQTRLDKHDAELSAQRRLLEDLRSEIGEFRRIGVEQSRQFGEQSSDTSSTAGSAKSPVQGEWCPRTVMVRGWAPFGSPASQKIDRIEYKKVANELLFCLPHCLQNNVMVRAPFAANYQISFGLKDGGGWDSCRAVQEALIAGEHDQRSWS